MKKALVLDGGGGKAVYTIGVLYELEQYLASQYGTTKLCDFFDVFFGTSSGGIISTGLASGMPVEKIYSFYLETLGEVMYLSAVGRVTPRLFSKKRSEILRASLTKVFYDYPFDYIESSLAIYATDYKKKIPRIFYTDRRLLIEQEENFTPGFGASIVDGLLATSAAYPIFDKVLVRGVDIEFEAVDGAFYANNPSLFALDSMQRAFPGVGCSIFNVGVGQYRNTQLNQILQKIEVYNILELLTDSSSRASVDIMRRLCEKEDIGFLRIHDYVPLEVDFFLQVEEEIETVFTYGRKSFIHHKEEILSFLNV